MNAAVVVVQLLVAEWARAIACSACRGMRKVRTGQGTVVGNANPARAEGKCRRNDTA